MVKWIKIKIGDSTFYLINRDFESDVELNDDTIRKCLGLVNCNDSPTKYQISLIGNDTILRVKPK